MLCHNCFFLLNDHFIGMFEFACTAHSGRHLANLLVGLFGLLGQPDFFLFILWFNPMQLGMRSTFILPTNLWLLDAECDPAQEA